MSWAICPLKATPYNNERPSGAYADVSALYTLAPGSRRYPRRMYSKG